MGDTESQTEGSGLDSEFAVKRCYSVSEVTTLRLTDTTRENNKNNNNNDEEDDNGCLLYTSDAADES